MSETSKAYVVVSENLKRFGLRRGSDAADVYDKAVQILRGGDFTIKKELLSLIKKKYGPNL